MAIVRITGWRTGFRKVSMTCLLRDCADLGLREAKHVVDDVLDGKTRQIRVDDEHAATDLVNRLDELGAEASFTDDAV